MTGTLASRRFEAADQLEFATFSGDYNPMQHGPSACAVDGDRNACRAWHACIALVARQHRAANAGLPPICSVKAQFKRAVQVGEGAETVDFTNKGDPLKLRFASGSITDSTFCCTCAFDDCESNWAIDIPCGGNYMLSQMIIARGPKASNFGMIRYGEEQASESNRSAGGRTYSLMADQVTLIDDGPSDSHHLNFAGWAGRVAGTSSENSGYRLVVKDSIIISNPKAGPTGLGPNVVDGGGNRFFAWYAPAGLQAHPFLPAPQ